MDCQNWTDEIAKAAKDEIKQEDFRKAVEEMKTKLRTKKSLLDKIFPYKIVFVKKG